MLANEVSAWSDAAARRLLRSLLDSAIASANPLNTLASHLPARPKGRCIVVGAGKAAASMAKAVELAWPDVPLSGVVVTPYGYGGPFDRIEVREAAHPVPDANSEAAARAILNTVSDLGPEDLVLALISGGGSSVLSLPIEGLSLADKQVTNQALLESGFDIKTMNAVRRRLSAIKGGKLAAAAAPATVWTLLISDIPGDDAGSVASGPTIAVTAAPIDLSIVVEKIGSRLPAGVVELLKAAPPIVPHVRGEVRMIATPALALAAAAETARAQGLDVEILGDDLEGEASIVGAEMARLIKPALARPKVILSGGETTVTIVDGKAGRGGRNTEFLLALGAALNGAAGVWSLAADTDGEDGASGGAAGALLAPDSLKRAAALGVDARAALLAHDSGGFFDSIGDLIVTGPTRTNVNDFRAILVTPPAH